MKKKRNGALKRTIKEYAGNTTIHGIGYVFNKEAGWLDRFLWLLVVLAFLALTGYFTAQIWNQWREEQVLLFFFLLSC